MPEQVIASGPNNIAIGDDVISSTIQVVTYGIQYAADQYRHRIQNFMREYLGSDAKKVPFGGRDEQMAELDAWLDDAKSPPYALLAAPAGQVSAASPMGAPITTEQRDWGHFHPGKHPLWDGVEWCGIRKPGNETGSSVCRD